jgi:hypothetical protein
LTGRHVAASPKIVGSCSLVSLMGTPPSSLRDWLTPSSRLFYTGHEDKVSPQSALAPARLLATASREPVVSAGVAR